MSALTAFRSNQRPRELRRRVMLRARMRVHSAWSDVCILNLSSRGLLINSPVPAAEGSTIEVWHGEQMIVATVMWRSGTRAGLQANERILVEQLLALGNSPSLQLTATWPDVERRKRPRPKADSRVRGRLIEFAGAAAIAASLASAVMVMVEQAFAHPLHSVVAALGG
jgi:hypothetical protein